MESGVLEEGKADLIDKITPSALCVSLSDDLQVLIGSSSLDDGELDVFIHPTRKFIL